MTDSPPAARSEADRHPSHGSPMAAPTQSNVPHQRNAALVLAITGVAVVLCIMAGLWQWDRYELRVAASDAARSALTADPVPLSVASADPEANKLRTVEVTGRWLPEREVALRLRPVDGTPGVHILTPLATVDGETVLVDRGFVARPAGSDAEGLALPPPTDGLVTVTGRVHPTEESPAAFDATGQSIKAVNLTAVSTELDVDLAPVWLELSAQQPPAAAPPELIAAPEPSNGRSLVYSVQWFIFAGVALVGGLLLIRSDRRPHTPDSPA